MDHTATIVKAVNDQGKTFYCTGRAGQGWISADINEAFTGWTVNRARAFAHQRNLYTSLHGLRCVAVVTDQ